MKDIVLVDGNIRQYTGNFHMHTQRSWDSVAPIGEALREYRDKGYDFCVVTDHEVYWDSTEYDTQDFIALSGVESAFILPAEKPNWILSKETAKALHINLVNDETNGRPGFAHNQILMRPVDMGLSSWNNYIRYCREKNQLVIINHPDWSRMDPQLFMGMEGCFAFEIWNSGAVFGGCSTDEAIWDYSLSRGRRILALTGDDAHKYGPGERVCGGGFTRVSCADFSRKGLVRAIKDGAFYPSTGPLIKDMRVENDVLSMSFTPAKQVRIIGRDLLAKGFGDPQGGLIDHIQWPVKPGLKYFRVEITDAQGNKAWSQPVFPVALDDKGFLLREDPHTPLKGDLS